MPGRRKQEQALLINRSKVIISAHFFVVKFYKFGRETLFLKGLNGFNDTYHCTLTQFANFPLLN